MQHLNARLCSFHGRQGGARCWTLGSSDAVAFNDELSKATRWCGFQNVHSLNSGQTRPIAVFVLKFKHLYPPEREAGVFHAVDNGLVPFWVSSRVP